MINNRAILLDDASSKRPFAQWVLYNLLMRKIVKPPRHIVWSTDHIDLDDPFQRRWLLKQTLIHGRAEDIRKLDWDEVGRELDILNLPADIDSLWRLWLGKNVYNPVPISHNILLLKQSLQINAFISY